MVMIHMGHVITRLELETKFAKIEVSQLQSTEAWLKVPTSTFTFKTMGVNSKLVSIDSKAALPV